MIDDNAPPQSFILCQSIVVDYANHKMVNIKLAPAKTIFAAYFNFYDVPIIDI